MYKVLKIHLFLPHLYKYVNGDCRIAEIQRNHKKIQRDIESKRSELRAMVGEQYRELINTADTIADMVDTVRDMRSALNSIQNSCKLGE